MIGRIKLLLSSYSFKFSLGFRLLRPEQPMPLVEFVARAKEYGLDGVQIADNVRPEQLSDDEIAEVFAGAQDNGIELQWGFEGWDRDVIDRLSVVSQKTEAKLLRAVFGRAMFPPGMSRADKVKKALAEVSALVSKLEAIDLILAIENHFDLTTDEVVDVVETLNELKEIVLAANKELPKRGLVLFSWRNVTAIDREQGIVVIKPAGYPYSEMTVDDLSVVDLDGKILEGPTNRRLTGPSTW